jgi:hypothetical protein
MTEPGKITLFFESLLASAMSLWMMWLPLIDLAELFGARMVVVIMGFYTLFMTIFLYRFCGKYPHPLLVWRNLRRFFRRRFSYDSIIGGTTSRMFQNTKH